MPEGEALQKMVSARVGALKNTRTEQEPERSKSALQTQNLLRKNFPQQVLFASRPREFIPRDSCPVIPMASKCVSTDAILTEYPDKPRTNRSYDFITIE